MNNILIIVLIGMGLLWILLFALVVILYTRHHKLAKRYKFFMAGEDGKSLEKQFAKKFQQLDTMIEDQNLMREQLKMIDETLLSCYQKIGIVKYDAFTEMGGKLSFALAMLNDENDGFVLNSMYGGYGGCYTYLKEIIKGESFILLSEEEKQALQMAMDKKNFME